MKHIKQLLIACIALLVSSCNSPDCAELIEEFTSYAQAEEAISSKTFTFSDECNTSKSSWILGAQYHSCDDQTGYFLVRTMKTTYIYKDLPKEIWREFKNADSFGKFYNYKIKGKFQLVL